MPLHPRRWPRAGRSQSVGSQLRAERRAPSCGIPTPLSRDEYLFSHYLNRICMQPRRTFMRPVQVKCFYHSSPRWTLTSLWTSYASVNSAFGTQPACEKPTDLPLFNLGQVAGKPSLRYGTWALSIVYSNPPQLLLLPIGAGGPKQLERGPIETYEIGDWMPDGEEKGQEKNRSEPIRPPPIQDSL